jgi:hypothetical protein
MADRVHLLGVTQQIFGFAAMAAFLDQRSFCLAQLCRGGDGQQFRQQRPQHRGRDHGGDGCHRFDETFEAVGGYP